MATHAAGSSGTPPPEKKLINLIRGWPSPHILPAEQLRRAADKALSDPAIFVPGLQYGPDPGYEPLRERLAAWLAAAYREAAPFPADPARICITGGASQNVACVLQSFTDPAYTRAVWVIAPCYFLACPIFEDSGFQGRLRAVPEDDEGIDLAFLEKGLREFETGEGGGGGEQPAAPVFKQPHPHRKTYRHIIYGVPTCANPSGTTMSLGHREALVQLARKYDALVICDDVYDLLQWQTSPLPPSASEGAMPAPSASEPLYQEDHHSLPVPPGAILPRLSDIDRPLGRSPHDPPGKVFGHAISNGSFSKLVGPGVRTGWVDATPDFAWGLSQTGSTRSGGAPSQLAAAMVTEMLAAGDLDAHLARAARPALRRRHLAVLRAVREHLAPLGVAVREASEAGKGVFGGYFVWLTLPEDGPLAKDVAEWALSEENLVVAPGERFEVLGDEASVSLPRNIRLCFSWEEEEDVVEGVARLGRAVRAIQSGASRSKGDGGSSTGNFK